MFIINLHSKFSFMLLSIVQNLSETDRRVHDRLKCLNNLVSKQMVSIMQNPISISCHQIITQGVHKVFP